MVYQGSKNRIAKNILPYINRAFEKTGFETYIEPFVGGANMIDKVTAPRRIGSDANKYLIALLNHVKETGGEGLEPVTKEEHKYIRTHKDEYPDWLVGYVGFCQSFRAKFFTGFAPWIRGDRNGGGGGGRTYTAALIRQAPKLKGIEFLCADYKHWTNTKNAVIYCDPPYKKTAGYNGTEKFDTDGFLQWAVEMSKDNVVIVSESNIENEHFKLLDEWQLRNCLGNGSGKPITVERIYTTGLGTKVLDEGINRQMRFE